MKRKVLVCFDGTWWDGRNSKSGPYTIYRETDVGSQDIRLYVPGLGNKVENDFLGHIFGGAIALGFGEAVQDALEDVAAQTESGDRLEFHVFGASRGAAMARHFVYRINKKEMKKGGLFEGIDCKIKFLGCFDTVSAVGLPVINVLDKGLYPLDDGSSAERSLHIVSEGDRRFTFRPSLMPKATLELWVPGDHGHACGMELLGELYTQVMKRAWCLSSPGIEPWCDTMSVGDPLGEVIDLETPPNGHIFPVLRRLVEGSVCAVFYMNDEPTKEEQRYLTRVLGGSFVRGEIWGLIEKYFSPSPQQ